MSDGYIQIDVNGEMLGIKFGMLANEWFSDKALAGELTSNGTTNLEGVAYLIYCGYKNNCKQKKVPDVYHEGYFLEWVEEVSIDPEKQNLFTEIGECYIQSKFTKAWNEKVNKALETLEDEKKKMIGSLSGHSVSGN